MLLPRSGKASFLGVSGPSLLSRLREHLAHLGLFAEPGPAVLAVSGGADSLAMLDLLAALAPELGIGLLVAHADHGILADSAAVAERVRDVAARRYGLETVVAALALGPDASETRARIERYRFLRRVQAERAARYLVTAHHADDQVETVLLRLLKGSGPAGLAGIAATGPHGLVRPLLPFGRAELAAHTATLGVEVAQDPTNRDPRHMRAWVRTVLLPLIESRLGAATAPALLAVGRHAASDLAAWDAVLDVLEPLELVAKGGRAGRGGRVEVARGVLTGYHNVLAERVLRAAARRAGLQLPPGAAGRLVRFAARAASGRRIELPGGLTGEAAFDRLVVSRGVAVPEPMRLAGPLGSVHFGSYVLRWRPDAAPADLPRQGWTTWVSDHTLAVRAPAAGDRLLPLGGAGHRKIARLLMEARVPRGDRPGYPLVVLGDEVVWIPGVCRGAAAIPAPGAEAVRVDVGTV